MAQVFKLPDWINQPLQDQVISPEEAGSLQWLSLQTNEQGNFRVTPDLIPAADRLRLYHLPVQAPIQ